MRVFNAIGFFDHTTIARPARATRYETSSLTVSLLRSGMGELFTDPTKRVVR